MTKTTSFNLSLKDQKVLNTPLALYEYIKGIYGVPNSEEHNPNRGINKIVKVSLVGLIQNPLRDTYWTIHLEPNNNSSNLMTEAQDLTFGVHWPSNNIKWSRIFTIEAYVEKRSIATVWPFAARCRYIISATNLFGDEHRDEFYQVHEFFKILNNFQKQY